MSKPKKYDHTHLYQRVKLKRGTILKCMIAGCPHLLTNLELGLMRKSLCHGCRTNEVILDKEIILMTRPMCEDCRALRKERWERNRELEPIEEEV